MSQGLYHGRDMMFRTQIYFCVCVQGGGSTCIEVEPYESEGQSYELCRSERNPADNKKTGFSSTMLQQECFAASGNSPEGAKAKIWRKTWDQTQSQQAAFKSNQIKFILSPKLRSCGVTPDPSWGQGEKKHFIGEKEEPRGRFLPGDVQ